MLSELPFSEELNVIKTDHAFKGYALRYKFELVDKKYQLIQLESSKSSIKDLFNDLLDGKKSFKHQITVKIFVKKYKGTDIESSAVYFNSTTKK